MRSSVISCRCRLLLGGASALSASGKIEALQHRPLDAERVEVHRERVETLQVDPNRR
jgi:hypothetical protein